MNPLWNYATSDSSFQFGMQANTQQGQINSEWTASIANQPFGAWYPTNNFDTTEQQQQANVFQREVNSAASLSHFPEKHQAGPRLSNMWQQTQDKHMGAPFAPPPQRPNLTHFPQINSRVHINIDYHVKHRESRPPPSSQPQQQQKTRYPFTTNNNTVGPTVPDMREFELATPDMTNFGQNTTKACDTVSLSSSSYTLPESEKVHIPPLNVNDIKLERASNDSAKESDVPSVEKKSIDEESQKKCETDETEEQGNIFSLITHSRFLPTWKFQEY